MFCLKTAADGCETPLPAVLGLPPQAVPSLRPLPVALIRKRTSQLLRMGAHTQNRRLIPAVRFTTGRKYNQKLPAQVGLPQSPIPGRAKLRSRPAYTVRPGISLHAMESSLLHTAADCTQCQHKCRKKCCAQSAWRERRFVSCDREHRAWASPSRQRPESEVHAFHRTLSGSVSHAVRDKVRRSVCRPALSGFRDCAVSAAPGIIKRTPEKRESFFTG